MELRQLQYVVAVADHLHFGQAAASLHTGQPAVSQQIRRLERELGTELFDRSGRRVRWTAAGAAFAAEARIALAAVDRAADVVRSVETRLRIGTSSGLGDRLDAVLRQLHREQPGMPVELQWYRRNLRLSRVASGRLDAAFVRGTLQPDELSAGLKSMKVWDDELVVAVPEDLPLSGRSSLRELRDYPLQIVDYPVNPALHEAVMRGCAAANVVPTIRVMGPHASDSLATIGIGEPAWTVLYASHARTIRPPGIRFESVEEALSVPTYLVVARRPATAAQVLVDAVTQQPD